MTVLVIGGSGSLGRAVLHAFRERGVKHALSLDLVPTVAATQSLVLSSTPSMSHDAQEAASLVEEQASHVTKFSAIVCAAGSWSGGTIGEQQGLESIDAMLQANLKPAIVTGHLASKYLAPGGLLVLTGAHAALGPTFGMVGYGMSKAATHHLVRSLASGVGEETGLPEGSTVVGVLPNVIDTDANRTAMPSADFSSWTAPKEFSDRIARWSEESVSRPENGSLISFLTDGGVTTTHLQ